MVKSIEGFDAELQRPVFRAQFPILRQSHIEVDAAGITKEIAARVTVGQRRWRLKLVYVAKQRTEYATSGKLRSRGWLLVHQQIGVRIR